MTYPTREELTQAIVEYPHKGDDMSERRFKKMEIEDVIEENFPTEEEIADVQKISNRCGIAILFLDGDNMRLLQERARLAETDPDAWLLRALNLQMDVDAGAMQVYAEKTFAAVLPLRGESDA